MSEPTEHMLRWASDAVGAKAVVVGGLRAGGNPWLVRFDPGGTVGEAVLRVGNPSDAGLRERFGTEVAALRLAGIHGLPAARLIADDLDGAAGGMAVLTTVLAGSSKIPRVASAGRLRAVGAAAAALHAVPLSPGAELPLRIRSLSDVDFVARRRSTGYTPLLRQAEERLEQLPLPQGSTVFVHGDLWQGNMMWSGDRCTGLVDWDCAGAGSPGVDLGSLRCDAALLFGAAAAGEVLAGWERASGRPAEQVAFWDLVAASCTLADMAYCLAPIHDQGRVDLDGGTLGTRRDAFLGAALARLDRC